MSPSSSENPDPTQKGEAIDHDDFEDAERENAESEESKESQGEDHGRAPITGRAKAQRRSRRWRLACSMSRGRGRRYDAIHILAIAGQKGRLGLTALPADSERP